MFEYKSPRGRDGAKKAITFGSYAHQFGWSGKWTSEDGVTHLFCRRGENETLDVWWMENGCVMPGHEPIYHLAGERIKLRNVSAAAKIVTATPDPDRLKKASRKRRKQTGIDGYHPDNADELIMGLQGSLPFDSESDDEEIEAVLHGRTITWVNRMSGETDSAFVNADKQFQVKRNGHDYITFCDAARSGFRSVYLDSIISVG